MERELKKLGITHIPTGVTQFSNRYRDWNNKVNPVMHMNHKAGDKMYVDYAGKTLSIIDKSTSEVQEVQFFVGILGASQ